MIILEFLSICRGPLAEVVSVLFISAVIDTDYRDKVLTLESKVALFLGDIFKVDSTHIADLKSQGNCETCSSYLFGCKFSAVSYSSRPDLRDPK